MPKLDRDNMQEFICEIIEHFEDFLDAKGIELDNPEKQEAINAGESDEDSICNIYGSDYGWLQSDIEASLDSWELVPKNHGAFSLHCSLQERYYFGPDSEGKEEWYPVVDEFMGYHDSAEDCKELIALANPFLRANPSKVDDYLTKPTYQDYGPNGQWSAFSIPDDEIPNRFWLYTITQIFD